MLRNIAKACKELAELNLISLPHTMSATLVDIVQCAQNLKKLSVHPEITADTMTQILRYRPTLHQINFYAIKPTRHVPEWAGPFPNLDTITLHLGRFSVPDFHGSHHPRMLSLPMLLTQSPATQSLSLTGMFIHTHMFSSLPLTSLILKDMVWGGTRFPHLPPTLQTLIAENPSSKIDFRGPEPSALLLSHLPVLKHLSLVDVNILSSDRMSDLLDSYVEALDPTRILAVKDAKPLESLTVRGLLEVPESGLFKRQNSLLVRSPRILTPALRTLDIGTYSCDDEEIDCLLGFETGLTSIDISHSRITGASIKALSDGLPALKYIRADNCTRINGRAAIDYAMHKGISVSCSIGEPKGSRKVRY
jgi:F-box/TPR repeat protein Pof3